MENVSRKTRKLIDASIDGHLSDEQQRRLDEILAADKEAATLCNKLMHVDQQLQSQKKIGADIDVSERVMQKILAGQKTARTVSKWSWLTDVSFAPVLLRYALVALVGILIGSAVTIMLIDQSSAPDTGLLSGTMAAKSPDGVNLQNNNTSLRIIPYIVGETLHLNFLVDTRDEVEVQVVFDPDNVTVTKADYLVTQGPRQTNFAVESMTFTALGQTSFQLILEKLSDEEQVLQISAMAHQKILLQKEISF